MTLDELDRWPDVYGRAWERKDVDAIVACFAPMPCTPGTRGAGQA